MRIVFTKNSWEDYLSWHREDKKLLKRIHLLIKEIQRTPFAGIGNPELLRYDLSGYWSRRIDREHRLVYKVNTHEILIYSCKYHYDK